MKATTWKRDSHGLFDYETSAVDKCELSLTSGTVLCRSVQGELKPFPAGEIIEAGFIPLFKVSKADPGNRPQSQKISK